MCLPGLRIFPDPNRLLSKSSLRCGCCTIFWSFGKSHRRTPNTPCAGQNMWSRKARRLSGAAKTPKRCWIQFQRIRYPAYGTGRSLPRCSTVSPRVSAVLKLRVDDYYHNGTRRRLRLHEKGGKEHEMPVHHLFEEILNEYIAAAGLQNGQPLFQSLNSLGTEVTGRALNRYNAWATIRKRARAAGFLTPVGCHTWRATGITIYLENDGRLEHAQQMAGHESPRTTKLYDRTKDEITLSEVERIRL